MKKIITTSLVLLTIFSVGCKKRDPEVSKVEIINGVPRLIVQGEVVRPRSLYVSPTYFILGSPTDRIIYANTDVETFIEIPAMNAPLENASIEMKSGKPAEFTLYSLKIKEEFGAQKEVFNLDIKEPLQLSTNNKIEFKNVNLQANKSYRIYYKVRAKQQFYLKTYLAKDGKLFAPILQSHVGAQVKIAKDAGIDIITFPVQVADFMQENGKPNIDNLKNTLDEIISANPNAKIIVRVRCYPPKWWNKKYPDDMTYTADGKQGFFASIISPRFRKDVGNAFTQIIKYCEANYNKNVVGYHAGGGNSCEWYMTDTWRNPRFRQGYGKSETNSWRTWLAKKYPNSQALQKAWNNKNVSLETAPVPTPQERKIDFLSNPQTQQNVIDFNRFRQDEVSATVNFFAKIIRTNAPKKLALTFYGYTAQFSYHINGAGVTGHFNLWNTLKSENIDIFCAPTSYFYRALGTPTINMTASETITRAGKIWLDEDDIRTHRCPPTEQQVGSFETCLKNVDETKEILKRQMIHEAIKNNASWWMDLTGLGWYEEAEIWEVQKMFDKIEKDIIANGKLYEPEFAFYADERSILHSSLTSKSKCTTGLFNLYEKNFTKFATPYGKYLFADFAYGKPINAKLHLFASTYALTANERKIMREKTRNTCAIFAWIPAYIDADKNVFSENAVEEATGFKVKLAKNLTSAKLNPTSDGKKIGITETFGFDENVEPLLIPETKSGDIVFATYQDGSPAVVLRGKHLFCGVANIPDALTTYMLKLAKVHRYSQQNVLVTANDKYVGATCIDGIIEPHDVKFNFKNKCKIFDAFTNEKLGDNGTATIKMKRGDTRVFRLEK